MQHLWRLWREDEGQDIAEYAVMLAVILVIVVGTIRLIGSNANNVFSNVASSIQSRICTQHHESRQFSPGDGESRLLVLTEHHEPHPFVDDRSSGFGRGS